MHLQCKKIAFDAVRYIFQHVGNIAPTFELSQLFIMRFSNSFYHNDSPNIYKEGRKMTVPYCNTAPILYPLTFYGNPMLGPSVGFSSWSAILFPVISRHYENYAIPISVSFISVPLDVYFLFIKASKPPA